MQSIFIKKCFLITVRTVCRVKRFTSGGKCFANDEGVETEVRTWPRQRSKDFYAEGLDALEKRWEKCINVGGGYVEKINIFPRFEYHMFYVLYPFVTYLLTLPRTWSLRPMGEGPREWARRVHENGLQSHWTRPLPNSLPPSRESGWPSSLSAACIKA
jgi:hypothetical protein